MTPPTKQRALFISPAFFGYERDIERALHDAGLDVTFYDERESNSSVYRAMARASGTFATRLAGRYFQRILKQIERQQFEFFILIKGESVPRTFVEELKQRNPEARFVYYAFDAIPEGSNPTRLFDLFDACFSFDSDDVEKYPGLTHKPLFYSDDFYPLEEGATLKQELSFVGTLHSDRYRFVSSLFRAFESTYTFLYVQARWYFAVEKYLTRKFAEVAWEEVSFSSLSKSEVAQIFRESRAVIDLQRAGQTGLTMRTFEVLASGAVLITANPAIRDADFYDPSRILVVEDYSDPLVGQRLQEQLAALGAPAGAPPGFDRHHISNWVGDFIRPSDDRRGSAA